LNAPALRTALWAQLGGTALVLVLVLLIERLAPGTARRMPLLLALLQGGLAALVSLRLGAPPWWQAIHLAFVPLAVLVLRLEIAPVWFLAAFVLLLLVFWRTDRSRVPLYLTNRRTTQAVLETLPAGACRCIDLGCGDGGLLCRLEQARPDCAFFGIEHAPLTWLLARWRAASRPSVTIHYGSFWQADLGNYDVVYAFLSPAPMARLWLKAVAEMRPGALLVSNSFPIPGIEPAATRDVDDRRGTRLYLYYPTGR